jgi:acylphosphatase
MVIHFLIEGRVQGVGFRWFAQREAAELGLRGWVRNTEEGAVELVASGPENDLDQLRAALEQGPRGSRVDRIHTHPLADEEDARLGPFNIQGAW